MTKIIRARAPLRLGLAGGGTDVSPFSDLHGGCVLNATIDLYANVILEITNNERVTFVSHDTKQEITFNGSVPSNNSYPLALHRAIYNKIVERYNYGRMISIKLTTYSDAPVGSGLGTSSTLVVSMLKAFDQHLNTNLTSLEIAKLAYEIERIDLGFAGGKQDQYTASFGGVNLMEFGPNDRVAINRIELPKWVINELEASTVLFYTGQSRESAKIIQDQVKNVGDSKHDSYLAAIALKRDAIEMKDALIKGNLKRYGKILGESWLNKKKLSRSVTNNELDAIYDKAISAGAISGKISGAGGGGFFMFHVSPSNRTKLEHMLSLQDGEVIRFNFQMQGVESWYYLEEGIQA
jgi:D-glycero-alpha-D-manno-heptose-7-phosphate kinase